MSPTDYQTNLKVAALWPWLTLGGLIFFIYVFIFLRPAVSGAGFWRKLHYF